MSTMEQRLVALQETNADLVEKSEALIGKVTSQLGLIQSKVGEAEQQMQQYAQNLLEHRVMSGNILMDPWLMNTTATNVNGVQKRVPATPPFLPRGDVTMEVVSQDTYAFGTRYAHTSVKEQQLSQPESYTDDPWLASEQRPIFAHLTDKHIMTNGGLSGDWNGFKKQGYISKFKIPRLSESTTNHALIGLNVGRNRAFAGNLFLFRAWVYVKSGTLVFGDHRGYNRATTSSHVWHAADFEKQSDNVKHPYQLIEFVIKPYGYCANGLAQQNFASGDNNTDLECYIASPQLFALDHPDDNKKPMTGETFGGQYA